MTWSLLSPINATPLLSLAPKAVRSESPNAMHGFSGACAGLLICILLTQIELK